MWVPTLPGVSRHRSSMPTFRMRCIVAGSEVLGFLIARHGSVVTESGWEVRLEQILVAAGFAAPVRQLPVRTS